MAKTKQQIRVLLADDHAIFRDGLRKLLDADEDITIVGEAQNGAECIRLLTKLKPDILLLDLRMPDKDGLAVLEEVNFDTLPTRVVVLTAAEDDRDVVRAPRAEAHGADNVTIVFGGRQDDDACGQRIEIDFFKDREAVFVGHAQIEQENFGLEFGKELDALRAILRFADDGNVLVGIEEFAEAIAKDRVVIG